MATNIMRRDKNMEAVPSRNTSWMDQFFQDNLNRFFHDDFWGFNGFNQRESVPVNIRETEKTYEMEIVAPGLKKEDFKLQVTKDLLTISFEQKESQEKGSKEDGWIQKEYRTQSFTRSFRLDDSVDTAKIAATYQNGMLNLSLPKKENAQQLSRNIEIK